MRSGLHTTAVLLAASALAACVSGRTMPIVGTAEDDLAARRLATRYASAYNAGDVRAIGELVTLTYQNVEPDGSRTIGRAAFQKRHSRPAESGRTIPRGTLAASTDFLDWIDATRAVVGGTYTLAGGPAGVPDEGSWLAVAVKDIDGQWRFSHSLFADFLPPLPSR
jgi:ketosteroid isomerase-like protein